MVVHGYNPSYLGGWGRRIAWTQEAEVVVSRIVPLHSILDDRMRLVSKKKKKAKPHTRKDSFSVAKICLPSCLFYSLPHPAFSPLLMQMKKNASR